MPLGQRLPGAYRDWRVVEDDLHDIARRMREYDPDARLVRQDATGHLGIAVNRRRGLAFARDLYDLRTDQRLAGCPDARVLSCQRAYDSHAIRDMRTWYRRLAASEARQEADLHRGIHEDCGDMAENMAYRMARDAGATNRAYIPRSV